MLHVGFNVMGNDISDKPALHCAYSFASSFSQTSTAGLFLSLYLPSFLPPSLRPLPSCFPSYFISRFSSTCVSQIRAQSHRLNQSAALLSLGLCMFCLYKPIKIVIISMQQFSQSGISQWCIVFSFFPVRKMAIRICHDVGMS